MKKTILFSAFIFNVFIAPAQWQQTNGPCGGAGNCFVSNGPDLFVATTGGVYKSTNNGDSWAIVNNGILTSNKYVRSVGIIGTNILAGMDANGIYLSTNNGNNWSQVSSASHVASFASDGTNIFAAAYFDVLLSADSGNTWTTVSNGLPGTWINALLISGTNLFAGTDSGVFISANNGTLWTHVGLGAKDVSCLAINGTSIFAGTSQGVYRSNNNGGSWTQVNSNTSVECLTVAGTTIFAGTYSGGIYKSTNNGGYWQTVNSGLISLGIAALYATATSIFAGEFYPAGISRSTNNGSSWITKNDGIKDITINKLVKTGSNLIAAPPTYYTSGGGGVFLSTDNGDNWRRKGLASYDIQSLAASGTNIFAGTRFNGLYLSTDTGSTWVQKAFNNTAVYGLALYGTDIFASSWTYASSCNSGAIFFSSDSGNTWTADTNGIGTTGNAYLWVDDSIIFASTCDGFLISTDYGASWIPSGNGLSTTYGVIALANIGSNIFAGTGYDGTYISKDTGITWTSLPGLPGAGAYAFAVGGTTIFATVINPSFNSGVYMSSDTGSTWLAVNDSLTAEYVLTLAVDSTYLFAGTSSYSVWRRPLSDLIPLSINKINKSPEVKIYPNPASTIITISTDKVLKGASIEIFNLFGEKVYSTVFKNKQQTVNIKTFQAGIYFVKIFDGENYCCRKIIKESD